MTDGDWICRGCTRCNGFCRGVGATTDTCLVVDASALLAGAAAESDAARPTFLGTGGGRVDA
jgi:hypothetical protein